MALDLWGSRIWLNVSIFYQFHKAKSRYLSSEPGHWFKKQLSKFSWNQSKDLTFAQIFAFCDLNVIFDNSNWIECVYILKFQIGVNSKAVCGIWNSFRAVCNQAKVHLEINLYVHLHLSLPAFEFTLIWNFKM